MKKRICSLKPSAYVACLLFGLVGAGGIFAVMRPLSGATVPASAENMNLRDVPNGTTKEFSFAESAIFPGTRRVGTVFIPAQYDGAQPACVYVRQDGYNQAEKPMLERLIAAREMPVTVGVFITPGEVPAPMKDPLGRRNRCFEYDGMGDNYVRFLTEELLPFVARTFDPDWEDDAGAESVCYAGENKMLVGTRWGIQVCADDGPTQVILPMPDHSRVIGVCFGGPELNTLFAFCGDKVWKRAVRLHGIGAFSPWAKVGGNPL